ncbi:hypothetical protein GCM10023185_21350 [Hymenobacter saemangeumensis]|uniref:Uncharacterized protein n=1 Tax=Hymenobacter saemangeumensis TaxID=1084522 RepID=A0ABP8IE76_9BACT
MPKLIDYPRTTYAGAWELGEVVDDTGGKCAIDTAARKLNRKVSGSFKAIIGSAVKFGLLTSKRDLLSTTTLFRRIKHAYDKQEELLFHREAFLTPPLFTQLCRKFRSRELPVQMLDVMLIREFGVEEINAQGVARAFIEGARMVGLLDEHNIVADIDQLTAQQPPRREIASPLPALNSFRTSPPPAPQPEPGNGSEAEAAATPRYAGPAAPPRSIPAQAPANSTSDAIASLFGLEPASAPNNNAQQADAKPLRNYMPEPESKHTASAPHSAPAAPLSSAPATSSPPVTAYRIQISGPGIDSQLSITEEDDLVLVQALLDKIRRQLRS